MTTRAEVLADRIAQVHQELEILINDCSDEQWKTILPNEKCTVGRLIHHVASMLPAETHLTRNLADGNAISGLTAGDVDKINAEHIAEHTGPSKEETRTLLRENSAMALAAIRAFSDEELDNAAPVSLHSNAPLTAQYFIEAHQLSHGYHHLSNINEAI